MSDDWTEEERDEIAQQINDSEINMADALAQEFGVILQTDDELTVLDYVAVAKVMNSDGTTSVMMTTRNDSPLIDTIGLLEYGGEVSRHRLHTNWGSS